MSCSPAHTRCQKMKEACAARDMGTVKKLADEARHRLESKGFVKARPLFGWIEKEWLEKALEEGAVVCKEGDYLPVAIEREEDVVVGHRGMREITEKKKGLDMSKYNDFIKRYEEYKSSKERQQYAVNEELSSLIKDSI